MLNLHATFTKGTVEFRLFQFDKPANGKQNAPNASKHSFLPYLFSCERKDRAAGGASETTTTERILASKASYPLCSFLPFQTAN